MEEYQYYSPQQIVASGRYPLTIGQIRHLLLYRHRNGLQQAIRKVGKRLMFRVDLFDQWIEQQKEEKHG